MLRQGSRFLLSRASAASMSWRRQFSTDLPAETVGDSKFNDAWKKLIPNVDMVIVPATTGQMGVLPGHVATIAELKPGILSVHEGNDVSKYFLSGGFAFVHANSVADIIAVEATPLDRIDPNLVQKGLADFQQKLNSASTDVEKAEAQIGVDVHSALNAALTEAVFQLVMKQVLNPEMEGFLE
ncbi:UNVERIFIED_CONTAM: ATP synthase subunit delta', mitochondrial [Sesamum calycinum]|uniref:ATP synthase subunit delta', mitochondrial n=1 Tax=Sesamum calycinum TaxID=2727403 RepID=A0AAW2LRF1_9LAMI